MKKNNNTGHRTGNSKQNISGEIDFGKDGRIVVKQTNGADGSQRTYKISDISSYSRSSLASGVKGCKSG